MTKFAEKINRIYYRVTWFMSMLFIVFILCCFVVAGADLLAALIRGEETPFNILVRSLSIFMIVLVGLRYSHEDMAVLEIENG